MSLKRLFYHYCIFVIGNKRLSHLNFSILPLISLIFYPPSYPFNFCVCTSLYVLKPNCNDFCWRWIPDPLDFSKVMNYKLVLLSLACWASHQKHVICCFILHCMLTEPAAVMAVAHHSISKAVGSGVAAAAGYMSMVYGIL